MSFISKALEVSEKAIGETEHSIEEYNTHRRGAKLFLKLGIATYAEQRLGGTHGPVERILGALDGHAAEHGVYVVYAGLAGFEGGKGSSARDSDGTVYVLTSGGERLHTAGYSAASASASSPPRPKM